MKKINKVIYKCDCSTRIELLPGKFQSSRNPTCPNCGQPYGQQAGLLMEQVLILNDAIDEFAEKKRSYGKFKIQGLE